MPAKCYFTGKTVSFGKSRTWRGQAVSKGGFGLKPTGINPRLFKANLHKVTAIVEEGGVKVAKRIRVSTAAIRQGLVVKPLKRKFGYTRTKKAAAAH